MTRMGKRSSITMRSCLSKAEPKRYSTVFLLIISLSSCQCIAASPNVIIQFSNVNLSFNDASSFPPSTLMDASLTASASDLGIYIYSINESDNFNKSVTDFCELLTATDPDVTICEADVEFSLDQSVTPSMPISNDPLSSQQWGLDEIGITDAWTAGLVGDNRVRICVMDSGVDLTHPDIQQNLWTNPAPTMNDIHGASFLRGVASNNINDMNGHGTHVNGIIGATANNMQGIAGINWNVSLIQSVFMDATGNGALSDAVLAYNYCLQQKSHIIHNSWGSSQYSQALGAAFQAITTKAVAVVTSAGNDGVDSDSIGHYPSGFASMYSNVLSVGSIDQNLAISSFSNFGSKSVGLSAPGGSIESLALGGTYSIESGTSFAAPFVTGVAGLLYSWLLTNRSINIDTQNVASLVLGSIQNGTSQYTIASNNGKTAHGSLNFQRALTALIASLAAVGNQTTSIGGVAGIVIGLVIGIVLTFVVMVGLFFALKFHRADRDER